MANKYKAQSRAAQSRRRRSKACTNKKAYPSREEAACKGQDIYKCQYCDLWHRTGQFAELLSKVRRRRQRSR